MFTIADTLLTRPLPVRAPGSLYGVTLDDFCSWGAVDPSEALRAE